MNQAYKDVVNELHAPARRNYTQRPVVIRGLDETFSADLVDMQQHASVNRGFKYILTVVDNFSKYAWARALKSKNGEDVTSAMYSIFKEGRVSQNIHVDEGKEFYNSKFEALLQKYNVKMYSTFSLQKVSIIERYNRTLKSKMYKKFTLNGNHKWIEILQDLVSEYNNTRHQKIRMKPIDVNKDNAKKLRLKVYNNYKMYDKNSIFKVADKVRISRYKTLFSKGYLPNWSNEIFTVIKVNKTFPHTYMLKDEQDQKIHGSFYNEELSKVKHGDVYIIEKVIRKKGGKKLVK